MKHQAKLEELKRRKKKEQEAKGQLKREPHGWAFWALAGYCLLLVGGGAWAVLELFVWNKLPPEIAGKWAVDGGAQYAGSFEFFRSGAMETHFINKGKELTLKARAVVKDKTLLTTTQDPRTHQEQTRASTILELTASSLILEFEKGDVMKMTRVR